MGYAFKGVCYDRTAGALDAFIKQVPNVDSTGIVTFTALPTISATGVITWSISHRPLTGTAATTRTGTTALPQCSASFMDQYPVQSILLPVAIFFAGFLGFRSGFRP